MPQIPVSRNAGLRNLLNDDPLPPPAPSTLDPMAAKIFLDHIVSETSRCTIEQLEQVYSGLMSEIYKTRGMTNRVKVAELVKGVFESIMEDIRACQGFEPGVED
jgi:ATPase family AAA domain-containing protein 2